MPVEIKKGENLTTRIHGSEVVSELLGVLIDDTDLGLIFSLNRLSNEMLVLGVNSSVVGVASETQAASPQDQATTKDTSEIALASPQDQATTKDTSEIALASLNLANATAESIVAGLESLPQQQQGEGKNSQFFDEMLKHLDRSSLAQIAQAILDLLNKSPVQQ